MTYDYGINPFVFTEDYESTPDLLTEGGCMIQIRQHLKTFKNFSNEEMCTNKWETFSTVEPKK